MSVSRSEEPSPNATTVSLPPETSDPKKYLIDICSSLESSSKRNQLVKNFSSLWNFVRLVENCVIDLGLGRKILAEIARVNPKLLNHFVHQKLLLDLNSDVRILCIQCIYDLIEGCDHEDSAKHESNMEIRPSIRLSVRFSDTSSLGRKSSSENLSFPPWNELKLESLEQKDDAKTTCACYEVARSSYSGTSNMYAIEEEDNETVVDLELPSSPQFFDERISLDSPPALKKYGDSFAMFIDKDKPVSPDEFLNNFSLSDQEKRDEELAKQEAKWFDSFQGTIPSLYSDRPSSILKSGSLNLKTCESDVSLILPDSQNSAFMYDLWEFGVLTALSDLASLDPVPECRDLAKRTLERFLKRAPNALVSNPNLPEKFGTFSRMCRRLRPRPASRPVHLHHGDVKLMNEMYGNLVGRTLVVSAGCAVFSLTLMSYFYGHCCQTAEELIITFQDDPLKHISRFPGFADMYHKLSQWSTVDFQEEQEVKLFDPEQTASSQAVGFISRRNVFKRPRVMFGVDPTNLGKEENINDLKFNTIILSLPQSGGRNSFNKNLVSGFLDSAVDILHQNGCIHISFSHKDEDAYEDEKMDEIVGGLSEELVAIHKFNKCLCGESESTNSKGMTYVLQLHDAEFSDSAETYCSTGSGRVPTGLNL